MAFAYKILGQGRPSTTAAIYTVPTGKSAIISSMHVCNNDSAAAKTFDLYVVASGGTADKTSKIMMGVSVAASGYLSIEKPITLGAGDSIQATNSSGDTQLSFHVFGTEVS